MPSLRGKRQSSLWLQAHADSWLCVNYSSVPVLIGLRGSDPQQVLGCSHMGSWLADLWAHRPFLCPLGCQSAIKHPLHCGILALTGEKTTQSGPFCRRVLLWWTTIWSAGCCPWNFGRQSAFLRLIVQVCMQCCAGRSALKGKDKTAG